jgi:hypothetical protein
MLRTQFVYRMVKPAATSLAASPRRKFCSYQITMQGYVREPTVEIRIPHPSDLSPRFGERSCTPDSMRAPSHGAQSVCAASSQPRILMISSSHRRITSRRADLANPMRDPTCAARHQRNPLRVSSQSTSPHRRHTYAPRPAGRNGSRCALA